MSNIVALLTDFGLVDTYVGVMKGVILNIYSDAQLIDISHAIRPQNVREGAFALMNSFSYFPEGTTFCVVIDPGVGSTRLPIAVKTEKYQFIAPDNGILSYALATLNNDYQVVALENRDYQLSQVSKTFHGRDIFSPASAYLARGDVPITDLGQALDKIFTFPTPQMSFNNNRLTGEVMHIDHFGNIITSIGRLRWVNGHELNLEPLWNSEAPSITIDAQKANITIHSNTFHGISHAYHEVLRGDILVQVDSNGFLEIGANQDDAAGRLDVEIGDKVMLKLSN
jgi:S-adenosyl-L-methionine hydrolase (adenosine-forming)